MTERHRKIREMKDDYGMTFAEIGEELGITRQAAWQSYHYVKKPKEKHRPKRFTITVDGKEVQLRR